MRRIKMDDLNVLVDRINKVTGSPATRYVKTAGKLAACIGNYHLNSAYGGHQLVRMDNIGGGIQNITYGFDSKRALYEKLQAFLSGAMAKNG